MADGTLLTAGRLQLADRNLLRTRAFIAGEWVEAGSGRRFAVLNPADDSALAEVPDMNAEDTRAAIAAAEGALPGWRRLTAKARAAVLKRWFALIIEHQDDLARILTAEQGKPLDEARGEVVFGAAFVEWYAEEARRIDGEVLQSYAPDRRVLVLRQPIGVVAAITPWNFPSAMITRKCAPAIAAGCTVVLKPAEDTPLSGLALVELAVRAGMPPGVINVVTASGAGAPAVGRVLTDDARVRKVSFTGSTEVGKILYRQSAETVKKISLELGGNAPLIVFDDADLDRAITGTIGSKFRNMGQTCTCANRVYVQAGVYDEFCARLKVAVEHMTVGPGWEEGIQQGPLINGQALDKVEAHVADALARGARVVCGGSRHALGGRYFQPTVLRDVPASGLIAQEETFGPVAALFRFETEEEVVRLANATDYGLAAYFYTADIARVWRVAEALEFGAVGVNEAVISAESVPIGGYKQSGLGREGARHGIEDFLEIKQVTIGGLG